MTAVDSCEKGKIVYRLYMVERTSPVNINIHLKSACNQKYNQLWNLKETPPQRGDCYDAPVRLCIIHRAEMEAKQ
jgi:hypothetical protein